jgi:hypothetical protein
VNSFELWELSERLKQYTHDVSVPIPLRLARQLFGADKWPNHYGVVYLDRAEVLPAYEARLAAQVAEKLTA